MKLVPGHLPPIPTSNNMDRLPLPLPFSPDLLWRYPLGFASMGSMQPPSSPLLDYKSQLPASLASDPRIWSREDVCTFLRWAEREFDLQPIDLEHFQLNGKAMCLLNRADLSERAPSSGDVLHNVLQILVRDANNFQRMLPSSPVTPTSRHSYPLSPHSQPQTPSWNIFNQTDNFHSSHAATLAAHLMAAQSNSVTLSPAPSVDSQNGTSPSHLDQQMTFGHSIFSNNGSNGSNSNPSDSDEDAFDKHSAGQSPPNTPNAYNSLFPPLPHMPPRSPKEPVQSPGIFKREFFPNDNPEPNTNGRLLWDFLQQLLNDPQQRYTSYIAWKNPETGVFKIVDPAGLAKLWGIQKNHLSMNYDKMSRALRYYYRVNILRKVQGERHCYQFLRNPTELKNIKNISLLRQQMSPTNTKPSIQLSGPVKQESNILQNLSFPKTERREPELNFSFSKTDKREPELNSLQNFSFAKTEILEPAQIPQLSQIAQIPQTTMKHEQADPDSNDKPTDLSQDLPTDLSSGSRHINIVCSPDPPPTMGSH